VHEKSLLGKRMWGKAGLVHDKRKKGQVRWGGWVWWNREWEWWSWNMRLLGCSTSLVPLPGRTNAASPGWRES
jgi:hypothetical protein